MSRGIAPSCFSNPFCSRTPLDRLMGQNSSLTAPPELCRHDERVGRTPKGSAGRPNRSRHGRSDPTGRPACTMHLRSSSSRRAIAFDQVTPLLQRRARHSTRRWRDARSPFGRRRSTAKGWSIYGAQRAQPVATGGKWDTPETTQTSRSATGGNPRQRFGRW
jgi:hypothetical protein